MHKSRRLGLLVAVALGCATVASAQHDQADVPPEEFRARCELKAADTAIAADPWDGRRPRETRFVELLRLRNPRATIQDLTPLTEAGFEALRAGRR